MAHHVDARYDGRDNMFLPPLRTIGFNPQLKMNDSLLAQSYVEAYDISYPEAIDRLANEVAEIRQHLENEGKFGLNNIGTIFLNEDGNYSFEPCEAGILTPEYYGLGGFDMLPLEALETPMVQVETNEGMTKIIKEETPAETLVPTTKASVLGMSNSVFDVNDDEEDKHAEFILIKKSWLRNLAAACIAIIAFFALSTPLRTPNLQTSKVDTGMLTRIMPKELVQNKSSESLKLNQDANKVIANKLSAESNSKNTEAKEQTELKNAKPYYSIVLASRVTKRNAASYVENLQAKGLKDAKVVITPSNVKVVYGTYDSENEAYKALNNLRHNEIFSDSWITKVTE